MRFYRPLQPVKALTFDLDDTLYDNRPVMVMTEQKLLQFLQQRFPEFVNKDIAYFQELRKNLRVQEPEIYHDVQYWRWRSLEIALLGFGYSSIEAQHGADEAMAVFGTWRSQIDVPEETHQTLTRLATKYPLVAITNGNMNPHACGLGHYFQFVLQAGPDGRAKPFADMFHTVVERLGLPAESILHVGDHLETDVAGAILNGLQACWLNVEQGDLLHETDARLLPHIEISHLASLQALL